MNKDDIKKSLRKEIKMLKNQQSKVELETKSIEIQKRLEYLKEFEHAKILMIYWSLSDEVQTLDLILSHYKDKTVLLPVVKGDNIIIRQFTGLNNMEKEPVFGILEPVGSEFTDISSIDLVVIPGVAFDKNGNRMGRGKAYYDKFLRTYFGLKVGVCFDFQLLDYVPVDAHDVKMDIIISNNQELRFQ